MDGRRADVNSKSLASPLGVRAWVPDFQVESCGRQAGKEEKKVADTQAQRGSETREG
jgi:hypothetical protein